MNFIKRLFVAVALFFCISTVTGQDFNFGVKAGMNYASISDFEQDVDNRIGFTGGVFFGARFNAISVNLEVLFSQQGAEFDTNRIDTDYALVPLIAKLHFLRIFNIQAGPQFSYLVISIAMCCCLLIVLSIYILDMSAASAQLSVFMISIIIILMTLNFYKFSIIVTHESLRLSFGCGWIYKVIAKEEIDPKSFQTDHIPWYFGMGWKYDFSGNQFFNAHSGQALKFKLKNKVGGFRVGTQDTKQLQECLKVQD